MREMFRLDRNSGSMIEQQVRDSAYHIINSKGSTYFAVGLALVKITASILRRQNSVLDCFSNAQRGIRDK